MILLQPIKKSREQKFFFKVKAQKLPFLNYQIPLKREFVDIPFFRVVTLKKLIEFSVTEKVHRRPYIHRIFNSLLIDS
jgi:hypothetical protein